MIRKNIQKMTPYQPPLEGRSEKNYLLLDFNEMTREPNLGVKKALIEFINSGRLHIYPEYGSLDAEISKYAGVRANQVMTTNGSDQGIDIVMRAILERGEKVIIPSPAFAMHYQSAEIQGARILKPSYNRDGSFPLGAVIKLMEGGGIKLLVFANPNNPLGTWIDKKDILKILEVAQRRGVAVLHDEAYFEFSKITCVDLINLYDNLFITRSFSKTLGIVATRPGYLLSQENNIKELLKIRGPYDINMFAKIAILAALKNLDYVNRYTKQVMEISKPMLENFFSKKGIYFFPSRANFLFIKIKNSQKIIDFLKKNGILVRPKRGPGGVEGIRISIGTLKDTEKFIKVFSKITKRVTI